MNKLIKIKSNEYLFVNEGWSTRNSWGHKTVLLKNNEEISHKKVRYHNRTWESYRYRSCMLGAAYDLLNEEIEARINEYKEANDIKRLKKGFRATLTLKFKKENELSKVIEKL
jgi:hypothetical protein